MMSKQEALFEYLLRLGDNSLILGHKLSEWCGHGPVLEQDIALINIALDLVGQSRNLLAYAGEVENKNRTEDDLAYLRNDRQFRNNLLAEQTNGDFGKTIVRQFFFDFFNLHLYTALLNSKDQTIAAFAEKSLKEVKYHCRHSKEWMLRLGDGTEKSNDRMKLAISELWMYTGELFEMNQVDDILINQGIATDLNAIKELWKKDISVILTEATLPIPDFDMPMASGSRKGIHSEHLSILLSEMQSVARAHPGAKW
jgi:ring-1,2-phenylacetyl-CoA epoxidase subunit PaaC